MTQRWFLFSARELFAAALRHTCRRSLLAMDHSTYGLPVLTLAEITGVHIDTARRWKRAGRLPAHHAAIVDLRLHGQLGTLDQRWNGWRLAAGQLWTPEDQPVRPGEIRSIPYSRQLIQELQRQLAEPHQRSLF